jgi:phosphoenolpyruvate-protein kinase (PTS system EI component)
MAEQFPHEQISYESALKQRDLEEGLKLMKERLLLVGQNLIESQEKNIAEITEIKRKMIELDSDLKRAKSTITVLSEELAKSARKEEVAILERQWKMFEPLEFARIEDIEKIIDKKIKHPSTTEEHKDTHGFWSGKL